MKTCHESAQSIWAKQSELNMLGHPLGLSTILIGQEYRKAKEAGAGLENEAVAQAATSLEDYWYAIHDEVAELTGNFFWKHWSKEAKKEGKRFLLTNPDGLTTIAIAISATAPTGKMPVDNHAVDAFALGVKKWLDQREFDVTTDAKGNFVTTGTFKNAEEIQSVFGDNVTVHTDEAAHVGTAQNVGVELVDLVFFLVSLMQCDGEPASSWENAWGNPKEWEDEEWLTAKDIPAEARLHSAANNRAILQQAKELEKYALFGSNVTLNDLRRGTKHEWSGAVIALRKMCVLAGLTFTDMDRLYTQKYEINVARFKRGRSQVGDTKAHTENLGVK